MNYENVAIRKFSQSQVIHIEPFSVFFRDMDNIDSLMEDITEQQQIAQEISDAISQPFGDQFDEVPPSVKQSCVAPNLSGLLI